MKETKKAQLVKEEAPEEIEEISKPLYYGAVANCERLNLRKNPRADAKVVDVLTKGTIVVIHEDDSTPDYYSVSTENNKCGFCYKDYIKQV